MSNLTPPVTVTAVPTNVSTETAVLTIPFAGGAAANPVTGIIGGSGPKNLVSGSLNITPGTSTTAIVLKCRQGAATVAGTQVSLSKTVGVTAAVPVEIPFNFDDTSGVFADAYTITVTQTGGTVAGTVNAGVGYTTDHP
jgi:hypothetical protein